MKLRLVLLLFYAACALASQGTLPYELLFFYYAYRFEIAAGAAVGKTMTARDCKLVGNACDFNDFVKFIQKTSKNTPQFTGDLAILSDAPTIGDMQDFLRKRESKGLSLIKYHPRKLVPQFTRKRGPGQHEDIIQTLEGYIGDAMQKMEPETLQKNVWYRRLKTSIRSVIIARQVEISRNLVNLFDAENKKRGLGIITKTKQEELPDGRRILYLDTNSMLHGQTIDKPEAKRFIGTFASDYRAGKYGTADQMAAAKEHQNIIDKATACENTIKTPVSPCTSA